MKITLILASIHYERGFLIDFVPDRLKENLLAISFIGYLTSRYC